MRSLGFGFKFLGLSIEFKHLVHEAVVPKCLNPGGTVQRLQGSFGKCENSEIWRGICLTYWCLRESRGADPLIIPTYAPYVPLYWYLYSLPHSLNLSGWCFMGFLNMEEPLATPRMHGDWGLGFGF